MTDPATPAAGNGVGNPDKAKQPASQLQVLTQYIKDLSFENPNVEKLLEGPGDQPNISIEVNVMGKKVRDNVFESSIQFTAKATNDKGVLYELEVEYAGLFQLNNIPDKALEPVLLVNCPMLTFPFLRRLVADITREGGFPPLAIDPIDFAALYMNNKKGKTGTPVAAPAES